MLKQQWQQTQTFAQRLEGMILENLCVIVFKWDLLCELYNASATLDCIFRSFIFNVFTTVEFLMLVQMQTGKCTEKESLSWLTGLVFS